MSDLPEVRLKALPSFPVRFQVEYPVLLDTSNGIYTVSLDMDAVTEAAIAGVSFDAISPTTTRGDLIARGASNNVRLAIGTSGYHLQSDGTDPSWAGFLQAGTGAVTRTWQSKAREFVSILDFGAVGSGNISDATANAAALTNALATGKTVLIPYASSGYHFGTNTITLSSGMNIVGERAVKLITTTTTMFFSCTGFLDQWGVRNVTIDGSGAGSSSTMFRFRTASAVVYRGRFDNIDFIGCYEILGDEVTASNYSVDIRFTNIKVTQSRGRSIYLRHTRGFMYFENIQHEQTGGGTPISWEAGRFEDAIGLEINRWDVSGGSSGTPTFQSGVYGLVVTTSVSVWLNRVEVDSTWGNGILLDTIRFLRMNECSVFSNLGNGMVLNLITESDVSNLTVTGGHGLTGDAGGSGLIISGASSDIGIANLNCNNCSAAALFIQNSASNIAISNYNAYNNFSFAYNLANTCNRIVLSDSVFRNNVGTVSNTSSGTANVIHDVAGYNPVGAVNPAATVGASPWTYTAGISPETLYISATTSITQITQGGVSILPQATGANGNFTVQLGPNEPVVITYTGTLAAKKMVH